MRVNVFLALATVMLLGFSVPAYATIAPNSTLDPGCQPTDPSCQITPPADSGANTNITQLSGLTTPISVANGRVGIGTTTPSTTLDVQGSISGAYIASITNTDGTANGHGLKITAGTASSTTTNMIGFFAQGGSSLGAITQNGTSAVAYNTTSDERLKENIVDDTKYGILDLMKINVKDFNYKSDSSKQTLNGFIAQQLEKIYPDAVTVGSDEVDANGNLTNPWSVDYGRLTPLLVESIQDQQKEIDSLKAETGVAITKLNELAISGVLTVDGHVTLGADTVGEATMTANTTSVSVKFTTPYTDKPSITISPEEQIKGTSWVSDIDANGFKINVSTPLTSDATFSWHAFAQKGKAF